MRRIVLCMFVVICALGLSSRALAQAADTQVIMGYVDYDEPLDDLIYRGFYEYVNDEVTPSHFPSTETGVHCVQYEFYQVELSDERLSNLSLLLMELPTEFAAWGYRFGDALELLSLGASYPGLQIDGPIVALGNYWFHPGCGPHPLAILYRDGCRELDAAHLWSRFWRRTVRILLVRECSD